MTAERRACDAHAAGLQRVAQLRQQHTQAVATAGLFGDVTEMRRLETEIENAQRDAQRHQNAAIAETVAEGQDQWLVVLDDYSAELERLDTELLDAFEATRRDIVWLVQAADQRTALMSRHARRPDRPAEPSSAVNYDRGALFALADGTRPVEVAAGDLVLAIAGQGLHMAAGGPYGEYLARFQTAVRDLRLPQRPVHDQSGPGAGAVSSAN